MVQVNQIRFSKNGKLFFRTVASGGVEVGFIPVTSRSCLIQNHDARLLKLCKTCRRDISTCLVPVRLLLNLNDAHEHDRDLRMV